MADRTLKCKDCGADFIFTEGEQAFYKEKGFENDPVRCLDCRRARKAQRMDVRPALHSLRERRGLYRKPL